jgi:phosphate starvation-inducible PhoH-like protein
MSNKNDDFIFSYSDEINKKKSIIRSTIKNEIKTVGKNESQKKLIQSIKNNEITICSGIAGSGKTYISLSQALRLLKQESTPYVNLILVKSVTTLKNEELGFLKGSLMEKIEPFMMSFYTNIEKIIGKTALDELLKHEIIKPYPLAYMRGVTFDNSIVISDEIQNITYGSNIRTLMSRIGNNSRLMMMGDENQIDLKKPSESALSVLMNNFNEMDKIGVVKMNENDKNIRNPLISVIENKFKEIEVNKKNK